ncbi:MAG: NAD-dependent epimerase/dehydratase family protein [Nocardioides sp.]|uniref:NAD-dependent epimerase/dehydratase family protein n=1 Tax=Nocardioides sp. TaxID=35761 RepID=UPI0039E68B97
MRVFVTGASGWIGSAVTHELIAHDHKVVGLARSDSSAAALAAAGATVHRGDLEDPDSLAVAAATADAVVHLAFKHDFDDFAAAGRTERAALLAMLGALEGTGRPFLFASGLASGQGGRLTEEQASPFEGPDSMRGGGENLALSYAERGVRPVAIRFAPTVHGVGDGGFTARLAAIAVERGAAGYVGEGTTSWAAVHRSDAARLVRLALDRAPAGSRMHAVGEEAIASRDIAAALGAHLGLPVVSVAPEAAAAHFGWIGHFFGSEASASNQITRETLGWAPTGPTLFEDIAAGVYPGR